MTTRRDTPLGAFIAALKEPRQGVHADGTEEMKTWEQLWEQCQRAASEITSLREQLQDMQKEIRETARDAYAEGQWQAREESNDRW